MYVEVFTSILPAVAPPMKLSWIQGDLVAEAILRPGDTERKTGKFGRLDETIQ